MRTALLHNGKLIHADDYQPDIHGNRIYCLDQKCKAPVIYVPKGSSVAHFKTTGKGDSQHSPSCGFYQPLNCIESIEKVAEYQQSILDANAREIVIRLSMTRIDPEYEPRKIDKEPDKKKDEEKVKTKNDNDNPSSIGSVKSVVKLMTSYEPDMLASILLNVGGGKKVPLSEVIISQERAHQLLWSGETIKNIGYFVYGKISSINRREKVIYINFKEKKGITFTLVVFDKYFKYFTYKDEELIDNDVLAYGHLRKNQYNDKQETEMLIKSDKYIELIKSNNGN